MKLEKQSGTAIQDFQEFAFYSSNNKKLLEVLNWEVIQSDYSLKNHSGHVIGKNFRKQTVQKQGDQEVIVAVQVQMLVAWTQVVAMYLKRRGKMVFILEVGKLQAQPNEDLSSKIGIKNGQQVKVEDKVGKFKTMQYLECKPGDHTIIPYSVGKHLMLLVMVNI